MIQPPHMEHFWKWAGILFSRPIFTFSSHSLLVSIIRFIWIIYYYEELTPFTYKLWIWFRFIWWQFGHGYPNSTERAENWFHSDQWSDFLLLLFFGHAKFYYAKSGYILPISDERAIYTCIGCCRCCFGDFYYCRRHLLSRVRIVAIIIDNLFVCWIFIWRNCCSCFIKMSTAHYSKATL